MSKKIKGLKALTLLSTKMHKKKKVMRCNKEEEMYSTRVVSQLPNVKQVEIEMMIRIPKIKKTPS